MAGHGIAAGSFAENFLQSFLAGQQLRASRAKAQQAQELATAKLAINKRTADVNFAKSANAILSTYIEKGNKPLFKASYTALFRAQKGDDFVSSKGFQDNLTMLLALDDEALTNFARFAQDLTNKKLEPGQLRTITQELAKDSTKGLALIAAVNKKGQEEKRKGILEGGQPLQTQAQRGLPAPLSSATMIALRARQISQLVSAGDFEGAAAVRKQVEFLRAGISVQPKDMKPESLFAAASAAATLGQTEVSAQFRQLAKDRMPSDGLATVAFPGTDRPAASFRKDDPGLDKAMAEGGVVVNLQIEDISQVTPKTAEEARKERVTVVSEMAFLSSMLSDAVRLGEGVAGIRGAAGEFFGGFAGQINDEFGELVTRSLTGLTPTELQQFRLSAQAVMAQQIDVITGEQTGRISEPERELTTVVTKGRAIGASIKQITASFTALIKLKVLHAESLSVRGGEAPGILIRTDADFNKAFAKHKRLFPSMPDKEIGDLVNELERQQLFFRLEGLL